ncbi:hypothetical protein [Pseudonocardia sp. NPDC049635]|uniref:hypothetical protein n=1 Tax=Pseudonocardia sp. NPDC049635 TaxID=3155506 RepID=UPI00340EA435
MTATTKTPLFGVDTSPERLVPFQLRSYGPRDPETGLPRETDHSFTARAEVDAATALGAMRGGQSAQAGVFVRFLQRTLLDDDGVPADAAPRAVTADSDTIEPDEDSDGELIVHGGQLSPTEWEVDGERFASHDLAMQHARENGSSLRRFADLMDDPRERVKLTALRDIVNYLAKESGGRPTAPSTRSPKPRTRKRAR